MDIRDFLENIAKNYDTSLENELRPILRNDTQKYFDQYLNKPRITKGSGANDRQNPTKNPFIAFLNADNYSKRPSTTEGIYPVYLFSSDLETLYLSINQGFTKLEEFYQKQNEIERQNRNLDRLEKSGSTLASEELFEIANMIRDKWEYPDDLISEIDLKSNRIGKHYEKSNIVAKKYATNNLPSNQELADDLNYFIDLDEEVREIFEDLKLTETTINQTINIPTRKEKTNPEFATDFVPRNSDEIKILLAEKEVTRTQTHEKIINLFKQEMDQKGNQVVNKNIGHIDLIININNQEIICEVKSVKKRAFMNAIRDAVGQLLYYSHFYKSDLSNAEKVILIHGNPGEGLIEWANLQRIGIIWKEHNIYKCCELSKEFGFEF